MNRPYRTVAAQPVDKNLGTAITPIKCGVEREPQTRRDTEVVAVPGTFYQPRHSILRRGLLSGQQLALGPEVLNRKHQLVVALPGLLRQQSAGGSEVLESGVICGRRLRAPGCDQIQVGDPLALLSRTDEVRAPIELVDNFENGFVALCCRRVRGEKHTDAQVSLCTKFFGDQGVRSLLHAVVQESIRIIPTKDEARAHGFPKIVMHALD